MNPKRYAFSIPFTTELILIVLALDPQPNPASLNKGTEDISEAKGRRASSAETC